VIPGARARDYLREMDPGVEQRPRRTTKLVSLALFSCALVIVVSTLFVPERAGSPAEAEHLGFLLDWAIVAAALAAPSWLGRRRRS
jgi:hypothetical protein